MGPLEQQVVDAVHDALADTIVGLEAQVLGVEGLSIDFWSGVSDHDRFMFLAHYVAGVHDAVRGLAREIDRDRSS